MKYNDNGEYKDIYVKAFDTLPINSKVRFTGSTVPDGWTQQLDYSTDEIDTGMLWIDGKKIYRRVFNIGTISTTPYFYDTGIDENYIITNFYGVGKRNDNSFITLPYVNDEINYQIAVRLLKKETNTIGKRILFQFNTSVNPSISNIYITVEYTK